MIATFTVNPHDIDSARAALLLLAIPDAPANVDRLHWNAETALRRTYGHLDRPDVTIGELRRAGILERLLTRRMTVGEIADASRRLAD